MAQQDVDNDGNWKIFLDKDCCEAVQRTLDNISLCIHIKTLHVLRFNYIMIYNTYIYNIYKLILNIILSIYLI